MEIAHRRDNLPVSVSTDMQDLLVKATDQNFVPVVDDKGDFIGIVTRRAIMRYFLEQMRVPVGAARKIEFHNKQVLHGYAVQDFLFYYTSNMRSP